jgi:hypothetical protein
MNSNFRANLRTQDRAASVPRETSACKDTIIVYGERNYEDAGFIIYSH